MRFAILADIHSNLSALKAVRQDMKKYRCDQAVCLGDVVGYGPNPKECVDTIRAMRIPCVKGEHDERCSRERSPKDFNPNAAESVNWQVLQLTADDRGWLRDLNLVQIVSGFTIVHATLEDPERWGYVFNKQAAVASLACQRAPVCFFGHTHVPLAFMQDTSVRGGTYSKFKVEDGRKYFVNPGSVGQSRDGDSKAGYAIYDLDEQTIELRRVAFDMPPGDSGNMPFLPKPTPPRPIVAKGVKEFPNRE